METLNSEIFTNPTVNDLDTFESYRITENTEIPPPVPVVSINGEIISTEGNLTTISGGSKDGKSAFTSILIAGAISDNGQLDGLEGVDVLPNTNKKAVIHIDTEQARHRHQSNMKTILNRCSFASCPDYFLSYNIRAMDVNEYMSFTDGLCRAASTAYSGIHLIVIDGIADFICDVNDSEQSNAIVKFFEGLAVKYQTPIIVIVHTNPNSDKERGHLGSQLQRKSESVLMVKKEGDVSYLEAKLLRMAGKGSIPQIQFSYDRDKGYHTGCGMRTPSQEIKDATRI